MAKQSSQTPVTPPNEVTVSLGNLTPADAQFVRNVVSLFADPQHADHLHRLQSGESVIRYEPSGGFQLLTSRASR